MNHLSHALDDGGILPPHDLPGLDRAWSREVTVTDAEGVPRRWHVLDNRAEPVFATNTTHC